MTQTTPDPQLTRQISDWKKEIARLQDLVDTAEEKTPTTPADIILPIAEDRFKKLYGDPLSMTMGEFVIIMRLAQERLKHMGARNVELRI